MDEAGEVDGSAIVAGGEAPEMLHAAEASFDLIAALIGGFVVGEGDFAVALGWDSQSPPGSPWENGYCESFNGKLRDELRDGEIFYTMREAEIVIGLWRSHFNSFRPHSALDYRPPVPEAILPRPAGLPHASLQSADQGDPVCRNLA